MTTGYEVGFYRDVGRIADSLHELTRMERGPAQVDLGDGIGVTIDPQLHEPLEAIARAASSIAERLDAMTEVTGELLQTNARIADALEYLAGTAAEGWELPPSRGIEDVHLPGEDPARKGGV